MSGAGVTEKNVIDRWERMRLRHSHRHAPLRNVNEAAAQSMTFGERASDAFAATMGSWKFILIQSAILVLWVVLNITAYIEHWDPYPFILLNLALSLEAAYAAPIIMMSQNRQSDKDRLAAEEDYQVNTKAEEELKLGNVDRATRLLGNAIQGTQRLGNVKATQALAGLIDQVKKTQTLQTKAAKTTLLQAQAVVRKTQMLDPAALKDLQKPD